MSLKFGAGHILCIIFVTFVESKLLPATKADDVDNSIDSGGANNDKGIINLTMPGTKWFEIKIIIHDSFDPNGFAFQMFI